MSTKNVTEIVREYLIENEFDGLVNHHICGGCSCALSNLIPCEGENLMLCQAAYKHKNLASEGFYLDDQKKEKFLTGDLIKFLENIGVNERAIKFAKLMLNKKNKEKRSTGDLAKLLKPTIEAKPLVLNNKKKGHENE